MHHSMYSFMHHKAFQMRLSMKMTDIDCAWYVPSVKGDWAYVMRSSAECQACLELSNKFNNMPFSCQCHKCLHDTENVTTSVHCHSLTITGNIHEAYESLCSNICDFLFRNFNSHPDLHVIRLPPVIKSWVLWGLYSCQDHHIWSFPLFVDTVLDKYQCDLQQTLICH